MASENEEYEYAYSDGSEDDDPDAEVSMEDWNDNPNAAPMDFTITSPANKSGIRFMKAEEIRPDMISRCNDVCDVLGITSAAASVLLREFDWSKETLLEQYMGDSDKVLKKAGVYNRCGHQKGARAVDGMQTCAICFDDTTNMLAVPCGHAFCFDCWKSFCENAVEDGHSCVLQTCPQAKCTEIVTEEEMTKALGDSSPALAKFKTFQLRSFVESNPLTRWCPGAGCERVAAALSTAAMEAEGCVAHCDSCSCSFCLVCGGEPHAPASCKCLDQWSDKCRNESETANWILANTKSCPKCNSRIEKNQGCNHVSIVSEGFAF